MERPKKSAELVASFQWEQKTTTTVNNFSVFSTNHRPDAVLDIEDFRIGIEIKKGDSGSQVEEIQIMLNMINKTQLSIDGDFGAKTLAAVVSFQKKYKLKNQLLRE